MATESAMRLVDNTGVGKWPSSKEAAMYASSSSSLAAEELGLLLKGHRIHVNGRETVPHRSGSAPPSMEGSFAAIGNLIAQQNPNMDVNLANLNNAIQNCESEEQLRADPAYLAYYCSNVNLNPRLPPPLISRENRRLVRHMGCFGNNRQLTSFDDSSKGSLHLSQGALFTHKEEPEDDKSPQHTSGNWAERNAFFSGQPASLAARHKSLVDLIQEDFPRTPSPVYTHQRSLNQVSTQEAVDQDVLGSSLQDPSVGAAKLPEVNVAAMVAPTSRVQAVALTNGDPSITPVLRSASPDGKEAPQVGRIGNTSSADTHLEDEELISGLADSDITSIESKMEGFNISSIQDNRNEPNNMQQHHLRPRGNTYHAQEVPSHLVSQGINNSYSAMDQFTHGHSKLEVRQPVLQSSGITPTMYATATTYMNSGNPFYPNLQTSAVFAPQYGVGGYALNTALMPPFIAGYPSQSAIPMPFDTTAGPSYNTRTPVVSTVGSVAPGVDLQHPYKFYGQMGLTMQPSFTDPVYLQYFQHPTEGAYGVPNQYDHPAAIRGGLTGNQEAFDLQKRSSPVAYTADQRSQFQRSAGVGIANSRNAGLSSPSYYGSAPNMGVLMQFPTSPIASPVMPGSPMGGISPAGRRSELRFQSGSSKNSGIYSGWQGQRVADRFDDPKMCSFLEELKSSKARKFELSDIAGRIIEFSSDQHGSRFIQQKLEICSAEEKASVFKEVLPHASKLMTDVFGNYVIQKFFEHGSHEQRKELADQLSGHILPLSLQMYGCRVIQKALEVIELDQKTRLVHELDGQVMKCVRDQNGNHVIQKCIECVPTEQIGFIISAFRGQVAALSTHPYGCRVIQRVLEYCNDERQSQCIVDEILESACSLAEDQYGNYVTQHVLERGKPHERSQIINKLAGKIVPLSQHKFASNVVEKCLEHGDAAERELLIEEIVGQTEGNDNLLIMMKDQFANYVVQKVLGICTDKQRETLLSRIRVHLNALKKYTYGKHIVVRFEQFCGEELHALET